MSVLFIDSNSELIYTKADEIGAKIIGMPYNIDDDEERVYDLGRNADPNEFFYRLKNGSSAKTSALNVQNYLDYFEPVLANGEDILYIHFSNKMSGTFEYMKNAIEILKEKYPERQIKYVDTLRISIGEALLVYEAGKLWKAGKSDEEIIEFIETYRGKNGMYFLVDDLNHLRKGGRLSTASCIFGTMLNLKPILHMTEDGQIVKYDLAKGRKKGISTMLDLALEHADFTRPICIAQALMEEEANHIKTMLDEASNNKCDIWIQPVGPTVGTHCGPGTIGITFFTK